MQRVPSVKNGRQVTLTVGPASTSSTSDAQLLCGYRYHLCGREKLSGHEYCLRHILEDRSAPFKQCNFTSRNTSPSKRCQRPAPKSDRKDGFCQEHSRRALMARQKSNARKRSSALKNLDDLSHYKVPKRPMLSVAQGPLTGEGLEIKKESEAEKTDLFETLMRRVPSVNQRAFDSSEMDSDEDPQTMESTWNGDDHENNSDADSVDSEADDPLKHAGCYSAEEVVRIMRDKLIRLQKLYIDQFQWLRFLLREEGRKYKHDVLSEKESELSAIHKQPKFTLEDVVACDKIKSLNHYQRPQGPEAQLHHEYLERRFKLGEPSSTSVGGSGATSQPHFKPTVLQKCSYHITSSTKCGDTVIPASKFCIKHILEDSSQILFRACGYVANASEDSEASGDGPCETPIADVLEGATCVYHNRFQAPFTTHEEGKPSGEPPKVEEQKFSAESDVDVTTTDADAKPNVDP